MARHILPALAGLAAASAVALGALGSHMLTDAAAKSWAATATSWLLMHVVAVFAVLAWRNTRLTRWSATLLILGAALFSGALYALAFGAGHGVAIAAPIGGTLMLLGWAFITVSALTEASDRP